MAGRNGKEVPDADKFDARRKTDAVTAFSYGQHECLAKDVALAFVTGLIKLVADLKQLRPAPGQMGEVKTIQVGTEKAYLNDSWSYLGFDASSKLHSTPVLNSKLIVEQPGRFTSTAMERVPLRVTEPLQRRRLYSSTTTCFRSARRRSLVSKLVSCVKMELTPRDGFPIVCKSWLLYR